MIRVCRDVEVAQANIGLTEFHVCDTSCEGPASSPVVVMSACRDSKTRHPTTYLLVQARTAACACSFVTTMQQFTYVDPSTQPSTSSALLLAESRWTPRGTTDPCGGYVVGTLWHESVTRLALFLGYCWLNNRSASAPNRQRPDSHKRGFAPLRVKQRTTAFPTPLLRQHCADVRCVGERLSAD